MTNTTHNTAAAAQARDTFWMEAVRLETAASWLEGEAAKAKLALAAEFYAASFRAGR